MKTKGNYMKPFLSLCLVLAAAAVSVTLCPTGRADAPPAPGFTIENHQRLVTVKDSNGVWLYAQVLSSPNVKIVATALGKSLSSVSLQDVSGKTLWSKNSHYAVGDVPVDGEWEKSFQSMGKLIQDAGLDDKDAPPAPQHYDRIEVLVGPDDQLVSSQFLVECKNGKHQLSLTPIKNGFSVKVDKTKSLIVISAPQTATTQASAR